MILLIQNLGKGSQDLIKHQVRAQKVNVINKIYIQTLEHIGVFAHILTLLLT